MKKTGKKILTIILSIILVIIIFFIGMQLGISKANSEKSTTTTKVSEISVETQTIKNTLTSSGQISSLETEKIYPSTSKYFKTMCVEEDDTVKRGENILEYEDGTYLTAEYDCVITSYNVPETGSICTSSNYIEVQTLEDLVITISVNENEIASVKEGQEVEITLTSDEKNTYSGTITKIDAVGTYSSSGTTFSATVEFENDGNVKIGMTASCEITLEEKENVIAVPIAAVQITDDEKYVIVVNEDGSTENINIETGISDDNYVEVVSGLTGGEKIQLIETTTISSSNETDKDNQRGNIRGGGMMQQMPDGMNQGGMKEDRMEGGTMESQPQIPN